MTDFLDEVRALVADWQRRLQLDAWQFQVVEGSPEDLLAAHVTAQCDMRISMRAAVLKVLPASILATLDAQPHSLEATIVHELLHCVFWPLKAAPPKVKGFLLEQSLNTVAHALVESKLREAAR